MDWLFVLKEVLGWAIPLICAGVLAMAVKPLKAAQNAQARGQEILDQEEWVRLSKPTLDKITARIETLENHHDDDKEQLKTRIEVLEQHDDSVNEKLDLILATVQNSDIKNTKAFIDIYQRDLIVDGKMYIEHKCITPHQLSNYEKRYKQYKDLGGNGDVEPWIKKIRELEVYYPTVKNYDDDK